VNVKEGEVEDGDLVSTRGKCMFRESFGNETNFSCES
jgi:hypothetical protein